MSDKNNNILNLYIFANTNKYDIKKYNKDRNFSSAELSVLACIDAVVRHSVYSNSNCDWNLSKVIRLILLDSLSNKMYPVDDKYKKIIDEIEYDSSLEAKMAKISINSIENKKETDPVINDFNNNYLKLQKVIRKGHIYWGAKGDRLESILEHIYGTLILAMGIETEYNYKIDFDKILTMLLLHETEKIKIVEWDGVSKEEKKEMGSFAVRSIFKDFKDGRYYIDLLDEFNSHNTLESKYAYMCDKLEYDMQVKIYQMLNRYDFDNIEDNVVTSSPSVRKIINDGAKSVFDVHYEYDKNKYNELPCMRGILELTKKM